MAGGGRDIAGQRQRPPTAGFTRVRRRSRASRGHCQGGKHVTAALPIVSFEPAHRNTSSRSATIRRVKRHPLGRLRKGLFQERSVRGRVGDQHHVLERIRGR